jgi:hypothetical protein
MAGLPIDPRCQALAGAALFFLAALLVQTWRAARRGSRLSAAEADLARYKSLAQTWECRIESIGLVWYPTLELDPEKKIVTAVKPGLPHCLACLLPLSLAEGNWGCPQCGEKRPESAADMTVLDGVAKQALKRFSERHPDYRAALKR